MHIEKSQVRKSSGSFFMHFLVPLRPCCHPCMSPSICWTLGPPFSGADQFPILRMNLLSGSQRDLDLQLSLIAVEVKMPKLALKPGLSWEQSCSFVFSRAESWSHEFKMCTRANPQIRELNINRSNSTAENVCVMQKGE